MLDRISLGRLFITMLLLVVLTASNYYVHEYQPERAMKIYRWLGLIEPEREWKNAYCPVGNWCYYVNGRLIATGDGPFIQVFDED
jgi:hypothetical protein